MKLLDFILNGAALLLWLQWRSCRFRMVAAPLTLSAAIQMPGFEKRPARCGYLAGLFGLLLGRGLIYVILGAHFHWVFTLELGAITLSFRSDDLWLMLLYSATSFGLVLGTFYAWLVLLSVVNRRAPDTDPFQRAIRLHLGWIEILPAFIRVLVPGIGAAVLWISCHGLLSELRIIPEAVSARQVMQQGLVLGIAA